MRCRPFYLQREFTAILLVAVHILPPPTTVIIILHFVNWIRPLENNRQPTQMDSSLSLGILIMFKTVPPKLHLHVDFSTRGEHFVPGLSIGLSDHLDVMLMPAHRWRVKVAKPFGSRYEASSHIQLRHRHCHFSHQEVHRLCDPQKSYDIAETHGACVKAFRLMWTINPPRRPAHFLLGCH